MGEKNRLLVTPHDSHATEQRRIEDEIYVCIQAMKRLTAELDEQLAGGEWYKAEHTSTRIATGCGYLTTLEYRLHDVKGINEQFARIQEHIDRIESQLKENSNASDRT